MGGPAKNIGHKAVSIANSIVNWIVLIVILLLLVFAGYALWDSYTLYDEADAVHYEMYKPRAEEEGASFAQLQKINPEVFSWLTVYGTHIDYPVVQAEDNWKYINTDAFGEYKVSGAIFLDYENATDFSDFNSILYGHHMEKNTMFGEIGNFADKSYFESRQYGNLYFEGEDHGLEFFAFLHVDAYDFGVFAPGIEGAENKQAYLDNLLAKAMHVKDVGVSIDDRVVLLSTCSSGSTNGRDILVARLSDEVYEDAFQGTNSDSSRTGAGVDKEDDWGLTTLWFVLVLLIFLAAVVLALVLGKKRTKRKRVQKEGYKSNDEDGYTKKD